ncbi:phosphoribosylformylglycinamidine cyclo-ligase [Caldicoprobacter algeriensis]|uniref:phosphoribosylformylglycinamidine cyclo-ligase n=1 Tax=Caldicoprobacter algeriensis TaxID=699281 RepID=UPI002079A1D6|nr:phosphoribosylformylglycinamidine cyclo-ligase [Caldicoprobacter algeriensis]MCM8899994.1 phosphoribosylformylglycinamidine cyclo-ligase [Caldicoprobacter algeriensis]
MGYTYKDAGVDVEAGYRAVSLMKEFVKRTYDKNVIGDIGGFGGMYSLDLEGMKQPVLVAGTDGVGTKLQLAFIMDKHDTIGQDCVAMCVNDVVCQGARPLFFLDYIATGRLKPEKVAHIVKGVADGCIEAGCALIGGETAEMPGFYREEEYDIAGFAVGIVDWSKIIDGSTIREGDVIIGLASSGVHSNGYSLVRRLVLHDKNRLDEWYDVLGCTVGEELLKPTRIYVKGILNVLKRYRVKGIANITGGGFIENIPRVLPEGLVAEIHVGSWPVLPIFELIKRWGDIEDKEMFNTFNMGIGMVLVCTPEDADGIIGQLKSDGYPSYVIGKVVKGTGGVVFIL